jgi:hypothetical protein
MHQVVEPPILTDCFATISFGQMNANQSALSALTERLGGHCCDCCLGRIPIAADCETPLDERLERMDPQHPQPLTFE